MAKYRHRIFEMYEFRDEAILELTPKVERAATEATTPESWDFKHLTVSRSSGVTLVQFKTTAFDDETLSELHADFAKLADQLDKDNKVVLDFEGVESFHAASINEAILLNKKLQNKGSRIVLCGLEPGVRESFFAPR